MYPIVSRQLFASKQKVVELTSVSSHAAVFGPIAANVCSVNSCLSSYCNQAEVHVKSVFAFMKTCKKTTFVSAVNSLLFVFG